VRDPPLRQHLFREEPGIATLTRERP
jgi:hypothetical protein